jgi:hypothetical protein
MALATLPFAREIGYPLPARRELDPALMERGLRAQARRVERVLASLLAGVAVNWTFGVVRGRVDVELGAIAGEDDLAVLSLPWSSSSSSVRTLRALRRMPFPLLLVRERARRPASIVVVAPPEPDPVALADVVEALAPRYGRHALLVRIGSARVAPRSPAAESIEGMLAARGVRGTFRRFAAPGELAAVLATESPNLVVLLANAAEASEETLDLLACSTLMLPATPATRHRSSPG